MNLLKEAAHPFEDTFIGCDLSLVPKDCAEYVNAVTTEAGENVLQSHSLANYPLFSVEKYYLLV